MRHILGVDVIPTNNDQILHLFDTSSYVEELAITCARLEITVPGFHNPRVIDVPAYFNLALNGITLDLVHPDSDGLPALPDGIYTINYSVSPAESTYVQYDYLRSCLLERRLLKMRCELSVGPCAPDEGIIKQLKFINDIEDYLRAAKAYAEYSECDKAQDLFTYCNRLMDRLDNISC